MNKMRLLYAISSRSFFKQYEWYKKKKPKVVFKKWVTSLHFSGSMAPPLLPACSFLAVSPFPQHLHTPWMPSTEKFKALASCYSKSNFLTNPKIITKDLVRCWESQTPPRAQGSQPYLHSNFKLLPHTQKFGKHHFWVPWT